MHSLLCIDVWIWPPEATPDEDYVFMVKGAPNTGCWSYVGKIGGRQVW